MKNPYKILFILQIIVNFATLKYIKISTGICAANTLNFHITSLYGGGKINLSLIIIHAKKAYTTNSNNL